jgi:hypothetical protein
MLTTPLRNKAVSYWAGVVNQTPRMRSCEPYPGLSMKAMQGLGEY